jgi:pimeloyl-ACP methyl ester carboxylesterase
MLAEERAPGTFRRLWFFEPAIAATAGDEPRAVPTENHMSVLARRRRPTFPSRRAAYASLHAKTVFANILPEALHAYVDWGMAPVDPHEPEGEVRLLCTPEVEAATFEHGGTNDALLRLPEITTPMLFMYGDAEGAFGPEMGEAVAARAPNAQLEVLHGMGHLGPFEDPARIAARVVASGARGSDDGHLER